MLAIALDKAGFPIEVRAIRVKYPLADGAPRIWNGEATAAHGIICLVLLQRVLGTGHHASAPRLRCQFAARRNDHQFINRVDPVPFARRCGNGDRALGVRSHKPRLVHRGNRFIGACPGHALVRRILRQNVRRQLQRFSKQYIVLLFRCGNRNRSNGDRRFGLRLRPELERKAGEPRCGSVAQFRRHHTAVQVFNIQHLLRHRERQQRTLGPRVCRKAEVNILLRFRVPYLPTVGQFAHRGREDGAQFRFLPDSAAHEVVRRTVRIQRLVACNAEADFRHGFGCGGGLGRGRRLRCGRRFRRFRRLRCGRRHRRFRRLRRGRGVRRFPRFRLRSGFFSVLLHFRRCIRIGRTRFRSLLEPARGFLLYMLAMQQGSGQIAAIRQGVSGMRQRRRRQHGHKKNDTKKQADTTFHDAPS